MSEIIRCAWALRDPLEMKYHDEEWGRPCRDDRKLFEMLLLEGMQAGLSWTTILKKRESMRAAFDGFDPAAIKNYGPEKVEELLRNPGIIRNRLKVLAAVENARAYERLVKEEGSLAAFLWRYVDGKPIVNRPETMADIPARTPLSDRISKDMKKRGFKFVGSTIIYAFMQAVGLVNDHIQTCARPAGRDPLENSSASSAC